MGSVVLDISMSLDGFVTALNVSPDEPLGDDGQQLHEWTTDSDRSRELIARMVEGPGAYIAGRRTYDTSLPWWGADGPTGPARVPLFVLSHSEPEDVPAGGVYQFVTDGIESALRQAREVAGDRYVHVMGGADIAQQFIKAGLVDEIAIHLVPVLFGSGTRLFDHLGEAHIQLETAEVMQTPTAVHLRFRVQKA